ncbi:MAG: protease modulator HflK, partial [Betaproteobacteria bacterium HGW-Betaproteobacteria-13]
RERMYLETMQQVLASTSKVMIDAKGNGNMLFLPLDKIMQQAGNAVPAVVNDPQVTLPAATNAPAGSLDPRSRDLLRSRERGER